MGIISLNLDEWLEPDEYYYRELLEKEALLANQNNEVFQSKKGSQLAQQEVLDLIKGKVFLNIELKGSQTALKTHELLQIYFEREQWSPEKILISSFNWEELKIFRQANQEVPIAILTEDDPLDAIPIGLELGAVAINPDYKSLNSDNVAKMQKAGFKIYPWTVNDPGDINLMTQMGVDGIITDFPERIPKPNY